MNLFIQNKGLLIANGNIKIIDLKSDIIINSENIHYYKLDKKIISYSKTYFEIEKNIK